MSFYDRSAGDYGNIQIGFSKHPWNDFSKYAQGYYLAAKQLAGALLEKPSIGDYEGYPVVFLYRHALELYLKSFIYSTESIAKLRKNLGKLTKNTHHLPSLCGAFKKLIEGIPEIQQEASLRMFLANLKSVATEFDEIDAMSDSFRYPLDRDGKPIPKMILKIGDIRDTFEDLKDGLDAMAVYAGCVEEGIREALIEEYFRNTQEEEP